MAAREEAERRYAVSRHRKTDEIGPAFFTARVLEMNPGESHAGGERQLGARSLESMQCLDVERVEFELHIAVAIENVRAFAVMPIAYSTFDVADATQSQNHAR